MPKVLVVNSSLPALLNEQVESLPLITWFNSKCFSSAMLEPKQWSSETPLRLKSDDNIEVLLPNDYYVVIPLASIVRIESQSNECSFLLSGSDYFTASIPLANIADIFSDYHFIRIHPSHLINANYLKSFVQCNAFVTLTNTDSIPVSSENSERIIEFLTKQNII